MEPSYLITRDIVGLRRYNLENLDVIMQLNQIYFRLTNEGNSLVLSSQIVKL